MKVTEEWVDREYVNSRHRKFTCKTLVKKYVHGEYSIEIEYPVNNSSSTERGVVAYVTGAARGVDFFYRVYDNDTLKQVELLALRLDRRFHELD